MLIRSRVIFEQSCTAVLLFSSDRLICHMILSELQLSHMGAGSSVRRGRGGVR